MLHVPSAGGRRRRHRDDKGMNGQRASQEHEQQWSKRGGSHGVGACVDVFWDWRWCGVEAGR